MTGSDAYLTSCSPLSLTLQCAVFFLAGLASYYAPSIYSVLRALSWSPVSTCAGLDGDRATARTATSTSTSRRATRTVHSCLQRPFGITAATSCCWHETLARVGARDCLGDKCACNICYVQDINRANRHCTFTRRDHRVGVEHGDLAPAQAPFLLVFLKTERSPSLLNRSQHQKPLSHFFRGATHGVIYTMEKRVWRVRVHAVEPWGPRRLGA